MDEHSELSLGQQLAARRWGSPEQRLEWKRARLRAECRAVGLDVVQLEAGFMVAEDEGNEDE